MHPYYTALGVAGFDGTNPIYTTNTSRAEQRTLLMLVGNTGVQTPEEWFEELVNLARQEESQEYAAELMGWAVILDNLLEFEAETVGEWWRLVRNGMNMWEAIDALRAAED